MVVMLLRAFAFAVLLLGLAYLYIAFEGVRIGSISPFSYLGQMIGIIAIVSIALFAAGKIARSKAKAREIEGAF